MAMLMKKRQLLTATLIIALGAAVAVNWFYNSNAEKGSSVLSEESVSGNLGDSILVAGTVKFEQEETTEVTQNSSYFATAKLKRSETNDEILDLIDELSIDGKLSASQFSTLNEKFEEYKNTFKWQNDTEYLILAKIGKECLVIINGNSCQVIVEKNTLNDTVILQKIGRAHV